MKKFSPLTSKVSVLIAVVAVILISSFLSSGVRSAEKMAGLTPKLSKEYVDFLKKQADDRKAFFADQSKLKKELRQKHKRERDELLYNHRQSRGKFMEEKHPAGERRDFFMNQRNQWAEMKRRQATEQKELNIKLMQQLREFQNKQKSEKREPDPAAASSSSAAST